MTITPEYRRKVNAAWKNARGRWEDEETWGVFVDESVVGGRSVSTEGETIAISVASILFPPGTAAPLRAGVKALVSRAHDDYGAKELHFGDIFMGRGGYKRKDGRIELIRECHALQKRLGSKVMATWVTDVGLSAAEEWCREHTRGLDVDSPKKIALFMNLWEIALFLRKRSARALVVIDEGLYTAKPGLVVAGDFSDVFDEGLLCSGQSRKFEGLQLADYVAYLGARANLASEVRTKPTPYDKEAVELYGDLDIIHGPKRSLVRWSDPPGRRTKITR